MSSARVFIILLSSSIIEIHARSHEERHKLLVEEFKKHHPDAIWTPHINPVFKGKDEGYFRSLLMRQGKMPAPNPSNLAKERENLEKFKHLSLHQNFVDTTTDLPEYALCGIDRLRPLARARRGTTIPDSFDLRSYSTCRSLFDIRKQKCGDCWAVAMASAFSDTKCLYTGTDVFFSARQLDSCVYQYQDGCGGGFLEDAGNYMLNYGITTGGDPYVGEPDGCLAYNDITYGMACPAQCDDGQNMAPVKAFQVLPITSGDVATIQTYILNSGPLVATLEAYSDFEFAEPLNVYRHYVGNFTGRHAIRVLGWGTKDGIPYWILANSWGKNFSDSGYVKFLRGSNHCGIESSLMAVLPMEANQSTLQ